jgi:hypothetical protein
MDALLLIAIALPLTLVGVYILLQWEEDTTPIISTTNQPRK